MSRIYRKDSCPSEFMENLNFNDAMPYIIQEKHFLMEDIVPLHCARSIEILACDGLAGEICINNTRYSASGKQVFVIPPYIIHSNHIPACAGTMYQFQADFSVLKTYIDLKAIFRFDEAQIHQLMHVGPKFAEVAPLLRRLIERDDYFMECITLICELFSILRRYVDESIPLDIRLTDNKNEIMRDIIVWTQENYAQEISLDEISKIVGYSKFHFCFRFKQATGMTYINFLNSVRVANACIHLREGRSISESSRLCGYNNVSYFIQVFKRIYKMTPKEYADSCPNK